MCRPYAKLPILVHPFTCAFKESVLGSTGREWSSTLACPIFAFLPSLCSQ